MRFSCDSIYEINPALNRLYGAQYNDDLYIDGDDDNDKENVQLFQKKFYEKLLQIQECTSEQRKRELLCDFLKMDSVFEFFMRLIERKKSIHLWNVHLLFNEYNLKKYNIPLSSIYRSYASFVDNVCKGRFNVAFERTLFYGCDDECEPLVSLLPNGWLDCYCYVIDEDYKDFCITRFYDSNVMFAGDIVHPSNVDIDFLDFIKTEDFSQYMNDRCNEQSYSEDVIKEIHKKQIKIENKEMRLEDLSVDDLEKLCSLYDMQIQNLSDNILALREELKKLHFKIVAKIIQRQIGIKESEIHLESSFRRDISRERDNDYLDIEEVFIKVEEKFNIEITEEEMKEIFLVEDLINLILKKSSNIEKEQNAE